MDVGLVCDGCSAFNDIHSLQCASCSCVLSVTGIDDSPPAKLEESEAGIPCSVCHTIVTPGNRFCGSCGSPMRMPTAPVVREESPGKKTLFFSSMQAAKAKLVLIKGEGNDGESYALAGTDHLIGSGDADIIFEEDPFLSPTHANFFYAAGRLMVEDRESTNGIYLQIRGTYPIDDNDFFLVGEQVIQVSLQEKLPKPAPQEDGTYFYSSPASTGGFNLTQILQGGSTGLTFPAEGEVVTLGREDNDINFPDDPFISGSHANVVLANNALSLSDLGSKNGTFIRITRPTPLEHGDYVFMGQQLLRVEIV